MTEYWAALWPVFGFLASQLVAAIIFAAKIYTRLTVLESIVVANKAISNGLSAQVRELDEHGSRKVSLIDDRQVHEHVRIDALAQQMAILTERVTRLELRENNSKPSSP